MATEMQYPPNRLLGRCNPLGAPGGALAR